MPNDLQKQIEDLKARMDQVETNAVGIDFKNHNHDGINSSNVSVFDIFGLYNKTVPPFNLLFKTVSAAPSGVPSSASEQVQVYVNGATLRLYWFDATNQVWHYVTATA